MPIYEYQCDGCNAVFEVFQRMSDPPPASHSCGSDTVHRILSNTSFVLKGTGWYATDYADKKTKPDDKSHKEGKKSDAQAAPGGEGKQKTPAANTATAASDKPKGATDGGKSRVNHSDASRHSGKSPPKV